LNYCFHLADFDEVEVQNFDSYLMAGGEMHSDIMKEFLTSSEEITPNYDTTNGMILHRSLNFDSSKVDVGTSPNNCNFGAAPFFIERHAGLKECLLDTVSLFLASQDYPTITSYDLKFYLLQLDNAQNTERDFLTKSMMPATYGEMTQNLHEFITLNTKDLPRGINTFKLDGSDPRVTFNPDYLKTVNFNGCIKSYPVIPWNCYLGLGQHIAGDTKTAPTCRQFGFGTKNRPANVTYANLELESFLYYNASTGAVAGTDYTDATSTSACMPVEFTAVSYLTNDEKHQYSIDEKLEKIVNKKVPVGVINSSVIPTTGALNSKVFVLADQSPMIGKYLTHIGIRPGTGEHAVKIQYTTNGVNGKLTAGTAYPELNSDSNTLCTINVPYVGMGATRPMIFALDGSDPNVTINATDLYDAEHGGFYMDGSLVVGLDGRARQTNTPGNKVLDDAVTTFIFCSDYDATANPYQKFQTIDVSTGVASSVQNSYELCLDLYTSEIVEDREYNSDALQSIDVKDSPLKGKYLSIIGDSISTWDGWSNVEPSSVNSAIYYPKSTVKNSMTTVDQTYWKKLVDRTGMNLLVNNAWSGSTVSKFWKGYVVATGSDDRCNQLHKTIDGKVVNPDYIVINIGTNDFDHMGKSINRTSDSGSGTTAYPGPQGLGKWDGRNGQKTPDLTSSPDTFREAYAVMLGRLKRNYPLAKIFCCTVPAGEVANNHTPGFDEVNILGVSLVEFNDAIREIAAAFGCKVIELALCGMNYYTLQNFYSDGSLHPNEAGMELYYKTIRQTLEADYSNVGTVTGYMSDKSLKSSMPIVSDFTGTTVEGLREELNTLLNVLSQRGIIASSSDHYKLCSNTYSGVTKYFKYRVVDSIDKMPLVANMSHGYGVQGNYWGYKPSGGRCAPVIDCPVSDTSNTTKEVTGYILAVNGGETLQWNPDSSLVSTYTSLAYGVYEYQEDGTPVGAPGQTLSSWQTANITLQSNTKYIVIMYRVGQTTGIFVDGVTKDQLLLLSKALTIA